MNKKLGIGIAVVVVVIAVVAVVVMGKSKPNGPAVEPVVETQTEKTEATATSAAPENKVEATQKATTPVEKAGTVKSSIKSLMAGGKSLSCTYSHTVSGVSVDGKIYITNDGKMRGDFADIDPKTGTKASQHVIINDAKDVYAWSDAKNMGVKMPLTSSRITDPKAGSPDMNAQQDFSCQDWTPDPSVFVVPTTVTFYSIG